MTEDPGIDGKRGVDSGEPKGINICLTNDEAAERVIPSQYMKMGDRIIVESKCQSNFEAIVVAPLGWGMVNGVMDWQCRQVGTNEMFTYGIHINVPVRVLPAKGTTDTSLDETDQ